MGHINSPWATSILPGPHRYGPWDTSISPGPHPYSPWGTSTVPGTHRYSMGHINSLWDTNTVLSHIHSPWDTSIQSLGHINTVPMPLRSSPHPSILFNIFPSTPRFTTTSLMFRLPHQTAVRISPPHLTCSGHPIFTYRKYS